MKKSGFSMIELIFAIVIIGILAAVALPRLSEMGESAKQAKFTEFVGVLNSTAAPQMWSKVATDSTAKGSIKTLDITAYIEMPNEWTWTPVNAGALTACAAPSATTLVSVGTVTVSGTPMTLFCRDGNQTNPPKFAVKDDGSVKF